MPFLRCGVCNVELESPNNALQHYSSSRHARELLKLNDSVVVKDSVTSSKEVLPILSSMAVEKGSRRVRRGKRDGIALENDTDATPSKRGLVDANCQETVSKFQATSVQSSRTRLLVMDSGKRPLPAPSSDHCLSEKDLADIFKEHNPTLVKLTEKGDRKRQLGFVEFASVGSDAAAREALHMTKHGDFTLRLKWEKEKSSDQPPPPITIEPIMEDISLPLTVEASEGHVRQVADQSDEIEKPPNKFSQ